MITENKHTKTYDLTEVNALVMTDFKRSVVLVSLFTNLTVFVSWAVIVAAS